MDYLIPAKIIREHPSCNGVLEIDTICGPHWVCAKEFYESARAGPAASQPAEEWIDDYSPEYFRESLRCEDCRNWKGLVCELWTTAKCTDKNKWNPKPKEAQCEKETC